MLQVSTIKFLKDLKKNNNKPWFEKNKSVYLDAKEDFGSFVTQVIEGLGKTEPDVVPLQQKMLLIVFTGMSVSPKTRRLTKVTWVLTSIKGAKKVLLPASTCTWNQVTIWLAAAYGCLWLRN